MKAFFVILLLAVLAAAVWALRDPELAQRLAHTEFRLPTIKFDNDTPTPAAGDEQKRKNASTQPGLRKCRKGHEVLYTNGTCPDGSKELSMDGGTVTVMPAQETTKPPAAASPDASRPDIQHPPGPTDHANSLDQRTEKIIGK